MYKTVFYHEEKKRQVSEVRDNTLKQSLHTVHAYCTCILYTHTETAGTSVIIKYKINKDISHHENFTKL